MLWEEKKSPRDTYIYFMHIYRKKNAKADNLAKRASYLFVVIEHHIQVKRIMGT